MLNRGLSWAQELLDLHAGEVDKSGDTALTFAAQSGRLMQLDINAP